MSGWIYTAALLALCSPYLQGAVLKLWDFRGAVAEVHQLGLRPAAPFAAATLALQWLAPAMVLSGEGRWLGALALAGFTLLAALLADRFWAASGLERRRLSIAFTEHIALGGAWLLVALHDLQR
jgi:uncharacterized membrane protein YphA (DoxX/SURF4 family)